MSFPCDNPCVSCPPSFGGGIGPVDPANPFVNLSSETPDVDNFIGRRYSIGLPPLGSTWYAVGCVGFCLSDVSQQDADLCAAQQAVNCQAGNWPVLVPSVVPGVLVPEPRTIYSNNPQQCSFTCPDGSIYTFTVAAGIFSSVANQATADAMAYSFACNKAVENHMCLGTLTPVRTCSGSNYEGTVIASTSNTPVSFSMVTALPDGLLLQQTETSAFIHGTPTTPGDYAFTIRATDSLHHSVDKVLNLSVFGISTTGPLPDATNGDPYSETLQYAGTPSGPVTWSLIAGILPTGVTLNSSTGEISGTPTNDGVFLLTIRITDGVLACSKNLALTVKPALSFSFADMVWDTVSIVSGVGVLNAVGGQIDWQGNASPVGCLTFLQGHMDVVLAAPQPCNLKIDAVTYGFGAAPAGYNWSIQILETILGVPNVVLTIQSVADFAAAGIFNFPFVLSPGSSHIDIYGYNAGGGGPIQFSYTRDFGAFDGASEINATLTP